MYAICKEAKFLKSYEVQDSELRLIWTDKKEEALIFPNIPDAYEVKFKVTPNDFYSSQVVSLENLPK